MYPLEPEENDYCLPVEWDGLFTEETFGDRLRLFYNQFNSSTRALLDDVLFREMEDQRVVVGLEILCPNLIIYKRLVQKKQKISNEIRWIWPETVTTFAIGIHNPEWEGSKFYLPDYWLK
jgi:hypothetical protein